MELNITTLIQNYREDDLAQAISTANAAARHFKEIQSNLRLWPNDQSQGKLFTEAQLSVFDTENKLKAITEDKEAYKKTQIETHQYPYYQTCKACGGSGSYVTEDTDDYGYKNGQMVSYSCHSHCNSGKIYPPFFKECGTCSKVYENLDPSKTPVEDDDPMYCIDLIVEEELLLKKQACASELKTLEEQYKASEEISSETDSFQKRALDLCEENAAELIAKAKILRDNEKLKSDLYHQIKHCEKTQVKLKKTAEKRFRKLCSSCRFPFYRKCHGEYGFARKSEFNNCCYEKYPKAEWAKLDHYKWCSDCNFAPGKIYMECGECGRNRYPEYQFEGNENNAEKVLKFKNKCRHPNLYNLPINKPVVH